MNEMKFIAIAITGITVSLIFFGIYKMFEGNYFETNPITGVFLLLVAAGVLYGIYKFFRKFPVMVLMGAVITVQSCNYAKSNQQVVVSEDCGMSWKKVNAGNAVPKGGLNPCYMKVVIPNYPMQGESKFITNLKDRVRASVHIDYDYSIVDALTFIKHAKFLGKANVDPDDDAALNSSFESAENSVIDKRIKDVAKDIFIDEDIVELDQSAMEDHLLNESNKVLEKLGVHLNFITLTFDLDEQTRQAIDIATAMKIYRSKGMEEVGKTVMAAKAGSTKITVETHKENH